MLGILQREPVRVYLYTILASVAGLLVTLDVLNVNILNPVLTVLATVLAVPAVEVARAKVSPTATVGVTDGSPENPEPPGAVVEADRQPEVLREEPEENPEPAGSV